MGSTARPSVYGVVFLLVIAIIWGTVTEGEFYENKIILLSTSLSDFIDANSLQVCYELINLLASSFNL